MKVDELTGKTVLVTGGARGLGEAICRDLADAGMNVLVADLLGDQAEQVAASLRETGCEATSAALDIGDAGEVERLVGSLDRLDVLVNNAGTDVTVSVEELEVADWDRVLAVNLRGPFLLAKHALPLMKSQGSGHIVNIVSTAAKRAWANASAYHASKWGLLGLSHALHVEARPHGIKVTALVAGGMRTPFLLDRFPDIDIRNLQPPESVARTLRFLLTQPEETVIPELMVLPMRETSWP
jgi:NAD(P)-dependent dehydrogenase (short-subunit alcohol dehydrogenase family)